MSSTLEEVKEWLQNMGYQGAIPETLKNICNASTFFIWKQLLENTKSKQEVDFIRKNVLINRLRSKGLTNQQQEINVIPEIAAYEKRMHYEKQVNLLKQSHSSKEETIKMLSRKVRLLEVTLQHLKAKNKSTNERIHLLDIKSEILNNDIHNIKNILTEITNLSPSETNEHDEFEIKEKLIHCAKELKLLLKELPEIKTAMKSNCLSRDSATKKITPLYNFEQLLLKAETKMTEHKVTIIRQSSHDKKTNSLRKVSKTLFSEESDTISYLKQDESGVAKSLFTQSQEHFQDVNTEECDSIFTQQLTVNKRDTNRESLGILPDYYFEDMDDDDIFMTGPKPKAPVINENTFESQDVKCVILEHSERFNSSIKIENFPNLNTSINIECEGNALSEEKKCNINKTITYEDIISKKTVMNVLSNIMRKNDRRYIWQMLLDLNDDISSELKKYTLEKGKTSQNEDEQLDLTRLYFIHVKLGMSIIELKKKIQSINTTLKNERNNFIETLHASNISLVKVDEYVDLYDKVIENLTSDTKIALMKSEINKYNKREDSSELSMLKNQYASNIEEIEFKKESVQTIFNYMNKIIRTADNIKEETCNLAQDLNNIMGNMSWARPLTLKLFSEEVRTFDNFPLEYNRKFVNGKKSVYFRDISACAIPSYLDVDSNTLYKIANILDSPLNVPEKILINILKSKYKLNVLKSLSADEELPKIKKYDMCDLLSQESDNEKALERINQICNSSRSKAVIHSSDIIEETLDIWTKMPLKDFICPKILVNDKNYKYYEEEFLKFFD